MSTNIEILPLNPSLNLSSIEEIFFITASVQTFVDETERERFKYKYLGFYLEKYPELVLVARDQEKILGYCLGSPETNESFYPWQPHLEIFADLFSSYPAHLHINLHPASQGLGIGQKLIGHWENLVREGAKGMHIMTAPGARNVSFYRRLGLETEIVRKFKGHEILFMGKSF
ncbi:MAG TPA: GNAT family N-acetyltransferase [Bacteriovoracaceae bacterium]|nr:GNAT family N-acetyltransferase [Bacteriovoracaceae bacterium]